jgi:hypothetical protein
MFILLSASMSALPSNAPDVRTNPAVAVARTLVPLLASQADAAERLRRPTDGAIQALPEAGLLQMMFPRRAGGAGHRLITHVETVAMLARLPWRGLCVRPPIGRDRCGSVDATAGQATGVQERRRTRVQRRVPGRYRLAGGRWLRRRWPLGLCVGLHARGLGTRHTALKAMLGSELYGRALLGRASNLVLLPQIQDAA